VLESTGVAHDASDQAVIIRVSSAAETLLDPGVQVMFIGPGKRAIWNPETEAPQPWSSDK
jgi:hypothetical protein